jgi:hypothetical protein
MRQPRSHVLIWFGQDHFLQFPLHLRNIILYIYTVLQIHLRNIVLTSRLPNLSTEAYLMLC